MRTHPSERRRRMAVALATVLVLALAADARAATPTTPYDVTTVASPQPHAGGRWAERLVAVHDLDGDGVNDLFVATPFADQQALHRILAGRRRCHGRWRGLRRERGHPGGAVHRRRP